MFYYIMDTIIQYIGIFATSFSAYLSNIDNEFIYFCFIYSIYIFSKLNLLLIKSKTYNLDLFF